MTFSQEEYAREVVDGAEREAQQARCKRWAVALEDWMAAGFTRQEAFDLVHTEMELNVQAFWDQQRDARLAALEAGHE